MPRCCGVRLACRQRAGSLGADGEGHPEEPHWYLVVIGSDPTVRGEGFGQALMRSRLDRCDAEHAPAYLEASKPNQRCPYYSGSASSMTGEIELPAAGRA